LWDIQLRRHNMARTSCITPWERSAMASLSKWRLDITSRGLADPHNSVFHEMSKHITCATTVIHDPKTAATEIDRVLNGMVFHPDGDYFWLVIKAMLYYSQPVSVSSVGSQ
jgi:hypothetical protein